MGISLIAVAGSDSMCRLMIPPEVTSREIVAISITPSLTTYSLRQPVKTLILGGCTPPWKYSTVFRF